MKALCIDNSGGYNSDYVTVGKYYDVLVYKDGWICVVSDINGEHWFRSFKFKTQEQIREEKLNELCIS